jgi:hypothetical protein
MNRGQQNPSTRRMVFRPRRWALASIGLAVALAVCAAAAPALAREHWGSFKDNGCVSSGGRTYESYSAVLWGIPFGASWEAACRRMPATVHGVHFAHPTECTNAHGVNEWGIFYVPAKCNKPATTARQHWGSFKYNGCVWRGKQAYATYASVLWGIPRGASWEAACMAMPATINGTHFSHPTACKNAGGVNEWGLFYVPVPVLLHECG